MMKRIVLKVDLSCQKCKKKIIHAVSGLEGVDKIECDATKSTLTITGVADPIKVIVRVRKAGKFAQVVSIGPPPPPPRPPGQPVPPGQGQPQKPLPGLDPQKRPPEGKQPPPVQQQKLPEQQPRPLLMHNPMGCAVCQQMSAREYLSCSIM